MNGVANGDAANLALQGLTVQGSSNTNSHDNKVVESTSDRLPRGKVTKFSPLSLTFLLLNMTCFVLANSVDPDQLASEEAN